MIDPWIWAVLLLFVGMALVVLDIFLPSGGIFAFLAVCAIIGAVWLGFSKDSALGVGILAGAVVGTIIAVVLALKYWPSTSLGKQMLLQVPTSDDVLPENNPRRALEGLVGRTGHAKSQMLPSGIVAVDGMTLDAISEGLPVDSGQRVRVIEVRGNRIVVRGLSDEPGGEPDKDPLAQPVEWDSPEPFRPSEA
jgi:membrane-bound serine protease (ClpP class)